MLEGRLRQLARDSAEQPAVHILPRHVPAEPRLVWRVYGEPLSEVRTPARTPALAICINDRNGHVVVGQTPVDVIWIAQAQTAALVMHPGKRRVQVDLVNVELAPPELLVRTLTDSRTEFQPSLRIALPAKRCQHLTHHTTSAVEAAVIPMEKAERSRVVHPPNFAVRPEVIIRIVEVDEVPRVGGERPLHEPVVG